MAQFSGRVLLVYDEAQLLDLPEKDNCLLFMRILIISLIIFKLFLYSPLFLKPTEPLFTEIGAKFIQEVIDCSHYFLVICSAVLLIGYFIKTQFEKYR